MFRPRQLKVKTGENLAKIGSKRKFSAPNDDKSSLCVSNSNTTRSVDVAVKSSREQYSDVEVATGNEANESERVKQTSSEQRDAVEGEPTCIVCGKYGEYVCDQTEADVCSLDCKEENLRKVYNFTLGVRTSGTTVSSAELVRTDIPDSDRISRLPVPMPTILEATGTKCYDHDAHRNIDAMDPEHFFDVYKGSFSYRQHDALNGLTPLQIYSLKSQLNIFDDTPPERALKPVYDFDHCITAEAIKRNMKEKGYLTPTPVQMQAIPYGLALQDIIVCSATSSGKTLGFLIPLIERIASFMQGEWSQELTQFRGDKSSYPLGVVLAPTRELASQIEEEAKHLALGVHNIKTALLIGGVPLPPQLHRLKQNVQIVVATPGRLCDVLILDDSPLKLNFLQTLIIDEVDCILKMGFQAQIDKVWSHLQRKPQVMMFSATIPDSVMKLARKMTKDPITIKVGSTKMNNTNIKHIVIWVEENSKKKKLFQIVDHEKHFTPPVLIFVESKIGAELLEDAINKMTRRSCCSLHGDKNQRERFDVLQRLADGEIDIVIATGVLGRGLDLVQVKQVIHFDFPKTLDEFIHRSGRVGRLGSFGNVVSFVNNSNKDVICDLHEFLSSVGATIPPELECSASGIGRKPYKKKWKKSKKSDEVQDYRKGSSLLSLLKERRK